MATSTRIKTFVLLIMFFGGMSMLAQDAVIQRLPDGFEPVIDGHDEALWEMFDSIPIETYFNGEVPSISNAFWQAAWNDEAFFVKVEVVDDFHCDEWCSEDLQYMSDKIELYFDVNKTINDGLGPSTENSGHYQIAPTWQEGINEARWEETDWR